MSKVVGNSTYAKQQYLADCNKHLYVYLNNKVYSQIMNKLGLFLFEHILIMYKCTSSNIPNHFYDNGVWNNLLFSLTTCYLQLISIVTLWSKFSGILKPSSVFCFWLRFWSCEVPDLAEKSRNKLHENHCPKFEGLKESYMTLEIE